LTHEKEHHYSFTEEEIKLYERFEKGYDLKADERYNAWLKGRDPSRIGELSTGMSSGKE
jgi:hypothetical protein